MDFKNIKYQNQKISNVLMVESINKISNLSWSGMGLVTTQPEKNLFSSLRLNKQNLCSSV